MKQIALRMAAVAPYMRFITADDSLKNVDGFSNPNSEIMDEIRKEEEEREREEKKNAAKIQLQIDTFEQELAAIELRQARAKEEAKTKALKARTDENEKYMAGGKDTEDHKKAIAAIEEEYANNVRKADTEFNKAYQNLKAKNPMGYSRSSRSCRW